MSYEAKEALVKIAVFMLAVLVVIAVAGAPQMALAVLAAISMISGLAIIADGIGAWASRKMFGRASVRVSEVPERD